MIKKGALVDKTRN